MKKKNRHRNWHTFVIFQAPGFDPWCFAGVTKTAHMAIITTIRKSLPKWGMTHSLEGQFPVPHFCVTRNPFARLYGSYETMCHLDKHFPEFPIADWFDHSIPWPAFVDRVCSLADDQIGDWHLQSQTHITKGLELAVILLFESLPEQWRIFGPSVGLPPVMHVGNVKARPIRDYRFHEQFYTPQLTHKVRQRYEADFERWKDHGGTE